MLVYICGGGSVAKSCLTLATPWTVACQPSLSMGFSRQEYWTGLPFPSSIPRGRYRKKQNFKRHLHPQKIMQH